MDIVDITEIDFTGIIVLHVFITTTVQLNFKKEILTQLPKALMYGLASRIRSFEMFRFILEIISSIFSSSLDQF
jgi:hypothetical protein